METWVVRYCTEKVETGRSFLKGRGPLSPPISGSGARAHTHTHPLPCPRAPSPGNWSLPLLLVICIFFFPTHIHIQCLTLMLWKHLQIEGFFCGRHQNTKKLESDDHMQGLLSYFKPYKVAYASFWPTNGHFIQLSLTFLMHTHTYSGVRPKIEYSIRTQILMPDLFFISFENFSKF